MKDQSKTKRTQEFYNSLKPQRTTSLAPRRGYYFIQSVHKQVITNHSEAVEVATALWRFDERERFDINFTVNIQLQTLRLNGFLGSDKLLDSIVNKIIHIKAAYVDFNESANGRFVCLWTILEPKKEDFNEEQSIAADEQNLQARIEKAMSEQEEDSLMVSNALIDQYEYFEECDNFESNMYLDMEERKLQIELSKDNNSSLTR